LEFFLRFNLSGRGNDTERQENDEKMRLQVVLFSFTFLCSFSVFCFLVLICYYLGYIETAWNSSTISFEENEGRCGTESAKKEGDNIVCHYDKQAERDSRSLDQQNLP
jgi:hypothetical protein